MDSPRPVPPRLAGAGLIHPVEPFKDAVEVLLGNAHAGVLHLEYRSLPRPCQSDDDRAAGEVILYGILHKVKGDLVEASSLQGTEQSSSR